MISKKDFSDIQKEMSRMDSKREESIILSREIIKLSKVVIYAVQRDDVQSAKKSLSELQEKVKKLRTYDTFEEGHYRTAMQEFVEAACFLGFASGKSLPTRSELGVSAEQYLLGICDLPGELVRKAINSAIKGNVKESVLIKDFVEDLYGELLQFDFRNSDLRRKFDGVKYDLKKLEDLAFEISLRKNDRS